MNNVFSATNCESGPITIVFHHRCDNGFRGLVLSLCGNHTKDYEKVCFPCDDKLRFRATHTHRSLRYKIRWSSPWNTMLVQVASSGHSRLIHICNYVSVAPPRSRSECFQGHFSWSVTQQYQCSTGAHSRFVFLIVSSCATQTSYILTLGALFVWWLLKDLQVYVL